MSLRSRCEPIGLPIVVSVVFVVFDSDVEIVLFYSLIKMIDVNSSLRAIEMKPNSRTYRTKDGTLFLMA